MEILFITAMVLFIILFSGVIQSHYEQFVFYHRKKGFTQQETCYRSIISQHIPYFNRLSADEQHKMLFRTYLFRNSKKFHYVGIEKREDMPILISAVATQLTLGLQKFSLNYFRDIYVLQHDYHYGYYSLPFMGHVDSTGIYLSWYDFLYGLHNAQDNSNVGLHEMAHALAYVNFITRTEEDRIFKKEFKNFSKVARPVFQDMQRGRKTLLGDYAATNYHEFWAVCVETFFGSPMRMLNELPDLYNAMVKVLNQDPNNVFSGKYYNKHFV